MTWHEIAQTWANKGNIRRGSARETFLFIVSVWEYSFSKTRSMKTLFPPEIKRLLITACFIQLHSLNCCKSTLHLFIVLLTYDRPQIGSKSFSFGHWRNLLSEINTTVIADKGDASEPIDDLLGGMIITAKQHFSILNTWFSSRFWVWFLKNTYTAHNAATLLTKHKYFIVCTRIKTRSSKSNRGTVPDDL